MLCLNLLDNPAPSPPVLSTGESKRAVQINFELLLPCQLPSRRGLTNISLSFRLKVNKVINTIVFTKEVRMSTDIKKRDSVKKTFVVIPLKEQFEELNPPGGNNFGASLCNLPCGQACNACSCHVNKQEEEENYRF